MMEPNQNSIFTNGSSTWNLEKTEIAEQHLLHDQNPMSSVWPKFSDLQLHQTPSNSLSSSSGFLSDVLGVRLEQEEDEEPGEELGAMKEMMYKIAAMQPVEIDPATIRKPKRRNVRISDDPQSVAARHRRERISEKIRILQRLVPGGTKMDTASMLDEAIRYVKFLKRQIRLLQSSPFPHPQCIGTTSTAVDQVHNTNINAGGSLNPGVNWPFEPNMPQNLATTSSMGSPAGLGFNFGDHAGYL